MKMMPAGTAVLTAVAASLLLGPALAIDSSHPDPDIMRMHNFKPDDAVQRPPARDTAAPAVIVGHPASHETHEGESAEGSSQAAVHNQILTHLPQEDNKSPAIESPLLDGGPQLQPELKRSEDGSGGAGAVLLRRETSAAPTVYGVSIWLILAWLALLYLMYKTGSLF